MTPDRVTTQAVNRPQARPQGIALSGLELDRLAIVTPYPTAVANGVSLRSVVIDEREIERDSCSEG